MKTEPWPLEIRLSSDKKTLSARFDDGADLALAAELLRVESPSAEVQGHHPSQKVTLSGKENVRITDIRPVGHYAVRLAFDDGHDTGIYSWSYLRALGETEAAGNLLQCGSGM